MEDKFKSNLELIYNDLSKDYNDWKDFDDFKSTMSNPDNRKLVYDVMSKKYDDWKDQDDFDSTIGYGKKFDVHNADAENDSIPSAPVPTAVAPQSETIATPVASPEADVPKANPMKAVVGKGATQFGTRKPTFEQFKQNAVDGTATPTQQRVEQVQKAKKESADRKYQSQVANADEVADILRFTDQQKTRSYSNPQGDIPTASKEEYIQKANDLAKEERASVLTEDFMQTNGIYDKFDKSVQSAFKEGFDKAGDVGMYDDPTAAFLLKDQQGRSNYNPVDVANDVTSKFVEDNSSEIQQLAFDRLNLPTEPTILGEGNELTEEGKNALNDAIQKEANKTTEEIISNLIQHWKEQNGPGSDAEFVWVGAMRDSILGTVIRGLEVKANNNLAVQEALLSEAYADYGEKAGWFTKGIKGATGMVMDGGVFTVGGAAANKAAGEVVKYSARKMLANGLGKSYVKKQIAGSIEKGVMDNMLKEYFRNNAGLWAKMKVASLSGAINFGTYGAFSNTAQEFYKVHVDENGNFVINDENGNEVNYTWGKALGSVWNVAKGTAQEAAKGAVIPVGGTTVGHLTRHLPWQEQFLANIAGFGTEVATFATLQGVEEGIANGFSNVDWTDNILEQIAMLGSMKLWHGVVGTSADYDSKGNIIQGKTEKILKQMLLNQNATPYEVKDSDMKGYGKWGKNKKFVTMVAEFIENPKTYTKFMADETVPLYQRKLVDYYVNGHSDVLVHEAPYDFKYEVNEDGSVDVTTYTEGGEKSGKKINMQHFANEAESKEYADKVFELVEKNNLKSARYMAADPETILSECCTEIADEIGDYPMSEAFKEYYKYNRGAKTEVGKKVNDLFEQRMANKQASIVGRIVDEIYDKYGVEVSDILAIPRSERTDEQRQIIEEYQRSIEDYGTEKIIEHQEEVKPEGAQKAEETPVDTPLERTIADNKAETDAARKTLGELAKDIDEDVDTALELIESDETIPEETKAVAREYARLKKERLGLESKMNEEIETKSKQSDEDVDKKTNKTTGNVDRVTYADGKTGYIIAGDPAKDESVTIINAEGNPEPIESSSIAETTSRPVEESKDIARKEVEQSVRAKYGYGIGAMEQPAVEESNTPVAEPKAESPKAESSVAEPAVTETPNETSAEPVVAIGKEVTLKDGRKGIYQGYDPAASSDVVEVNGIPEYVNSSDIVTEAPKTTPTEQAAEPVAETTAPASNVPLDEKGNLDVKNATPEQMGMYAIDTLGDLAPSWINGRIGSLEKEVGKMVDKDGNLKYVDDMKKFAENKSKLDELNAELEKWRKVKESLETPKEEAKVEEPIAEEPVVEEPKAEETPVEEKPIGETPASEEVKTEEPIVEQTAEAVPAEKTEATADVKEAPRSEAPKKADEPLKTTGLIRDSYTETQDKRTMDLLDALAKKLGLQIRFTDRVDGGLANASIEGRVIRIERGNPNPIGFLAGHEITHRVRKVSPEAWDSFKTEAIKAMGEEKWNSLIENEKNAWTINGKMTKSQDFIEEEAICDFAGELFRDENKQMCDRFLGNADRSTLQIIKDFYESIKDFFTGKDATPEDVSKYQSAIDKLNEALDAVSSKENLAKQGVTVMDGTATTNLETKESRKFAPMTKEEIDNAVKDLVKAGIDEKDAKKWVKSETSIATLLGKEYYSELDYIGDESHDFIQKDSDYPQGTVDASNVCKKRRVFTDLYDRISKMFPNTVITADNLDKIREIMVKRGDVVACGFCYVEERRLKMGEVADEFIKGMQEQNKFETYINDKGDAENKRKVANEVVEILGDDAYIPSIYDLTSLTGRQELQKNHPNIFNAFKRYNAARGQGSINLFQGDAEYQRDIRKWTKSRVKMVNKHGGLRIFSYSDFEAPHLIDIIQVIQDCALKGIKIQGYTKVPAFAKAVAKTGAKINRSLVPSGKGWHVDENGKKVLDFDPVEGIDVNDPDFFDSTRNPNVGNILIGINDEQIRLAMASPFVDYIIPFHTRLPKAVRESKHITEKDGWEDHTYNNGERNISDGKKASKHINIYTEVLDAAEAEGNPIKNARQFVEKYLDVCKKKGLIPVFEQYLDGNVEDGFKYVKGYEKMLVGFKLFDKNGNILPQEPVKAIFDDKFNKTILDRYVEESGTKVAPDDLVNEVVDALGLNNNPEPPTPKFSRNDGESMKDFANRNADRFGKDNEIKSSKDFEKGKSYDETLVSDVFDEELQKQIDSPKEMEGHVYRLGKPSEKLIKTGFPADQVMEMTASHLKQKSEDKHHPFPLGAVKGLVKALRNPIAVFGYGDKTKSQNAIVEMKYNGDNFLIGVHFGQEKGGNIVASVRGVFPKYNTEWMSWMLNEGKLLGVDKSKVLPLIDEMRDILSDPEKTKAYTSQRHTGRADVTSIDLDSVAKVVNEFGTTNSDEVIFDNINNSDVKFSKKQTAPKAYQEAIESGDEKSARTALDEYAKGKGYTIHAYHGTSRADRVGNVFRPERATSGPMSFFTSSKTIADNYARDKKDTSMAYDGDWAENDYHSQFHVNVGGYAGDVRMENAWGYLPFDARKRITEKAEQLGNDSEGNIIVKEGYKKGTGNFDWNLQQRRGNAIKALIDEWLDSGNLFNEENRFMEVLEKAGVLEEFEKMGWKDAKFLDPTFTDPKTYDTYLKIKKPFDTNDAYNEEFVSGLEKWWDGLSTRKKNSYNRDSMEADHWDKNSKSVDDWIEDAREDLSNGSTWAWTTIPDAVTDYLKSLGHDGIIDRGGKGGGDTHEVYIPFSSEQIKSAELKTYDDEGNLIPLDKRFDRKEEDIRYSRKTDVVTNEDGTPKTFYHGTGSDFKEIEPGKFGAWFTDTKESAEGYRRQRSEETGLKGDVKSAHLKMSNPYIIDADGADFRNIPVEYEVYNDAEDKSYYFKSKDEAMNYAEKNSIDKDDVRVSGIWGSEDVAKYAKENGFDSVVIRNVSDSAIESEGLQDSYAVFDKSQIEYPDEPKFSRKTLAETNSDLKTELSDLRKKIRGMRETDDVKENAKELVNFVREKLGEGAASEMGSMAIEGLVSRVANATTKTELEKAEQGIEQYINDYEISSADKVIDGMLNTELTSLNNRGVRTGVKVDRNTRNAFGLVKGMKTSLESTPVDAELRELRAEMSRLGKERNRLEAEGEDTSAIVSEQATIRSRYEAAKTRKETELASNRERIDRENEALQEQVDQEIAAALDGNGQLSESTKELYMSMPARRGLARLANLKAELAELRNDYRQKRSEAYANKGQARKELLAESDAIAEQITETQREIIDQQRHSEQDLNNLVGNGAEEYRKQRTAKLEQRKMIVRSACQEVSKNPIIDRGDNVMPPLTKQTKKLWNKVFGVNGFINAPLNSFEYLLKKISKNARAGEGEIYDYFIRGDRGLMQAEIDMYELGDSFGKSLDSKAAEIFGDANWFDRHTGGSAFAKLKRDSEKAAKNVYKTYIDGTDGRVHEYDHDSTKGDALYLWLAWRQAEGRMKMVKEGFTEQSMRDIENYIGEDYMKFGEWMTSEFLPKLREEVYNPIYVELFGTDMAARDNYFPLKVESPAGKDADENMQNATLPSNVVGYTIERTNNTRRLRYEVNAFDAIADYGNSMSEWAAFAHAKEDFNALMSSPRFKDLIEANDEGMYRTLLDAYKTAVHKMNNKAVYFDNIDDTLRKVATNLQGSAIAFGTYTAAKQILSYPAFLSYQGDGKYYTDLLTNLVTPRSNYKWAMENLPLFRQRADSRTMGIEGLSDENYFGRFDRELSRLGTYANRGMDKLTIAAGAKAVYDSMYRKCIAEGHTEEGAKRLASIEAQLVYNQSQQSGVSMFSSTAQKHGAGAVKAVLAFQNASMGYARMMRTGIYEILNSNRVYDADVKKAEELYSDSLEGGMSEEQASALRNKAIESAEKKKRNSRLHGILTTALFGGVLNAVWTWGSSPSMIYKQFNPDDEASDEDWASVISSMYTGILSGTTVGPAINSYANGFEYAPLNAWDELKELHKTYSDGSSDEIAWAVGRYFSRALLSLDPDKLMTMYHGAEELFKEDSNMTLATIELLAVSPSNRKKILQSMMKDSGVTDFANTYADATMVEVDSKHAANLTKKWAESKDKKMAEEMALVKEMMNKILKAETEEEIAEIKADKKYKDVAKYDDYNEWSDLYYTYDDIITDARERLKDGFHDPESEEELNKELEKVIEDWKKLK